MSKSKMKGSKPSKTSDVLSQVKSGSVTKPADSTKAKSKDVANPIAKKQEKVNNVVKQPTPSESGDSSDESASDSETEIEVKKPVVNGKINGIKVAKRESDSESVSSDNSEVSSESEGEEKPSVSAVMGAKVEEEADTDSGDSSASEDNLPALKRASKTNGVAQDDEESDEDSSEESESESDAPAVKQVSKTNGVAKPAKAESKDSDDGNSEEDSDSDSNGSGDSDNSEESAGEEGPEVKPKVAKRKAEDVPERATKKAKAEEEAANGPNLFVGNLSWNVTEEWLKEEFEEFGELTGVRLMTDRASGRSKGFGYIEFARAADAAKAHVAKKDVELDGRAMNVDFANSKPNDRQRMDNRSKAYGDSESTPSDTLFMGNLPFSADADKITEAFEPHGSIQGIRLPTDQETGKPRGFGYITFSSVDEASAALQAMKGFYLDGRPLRLDYTQPRDNSRGGDDSPRGGFNARGRGGFGGRGGRGGFNDRGRGGFNDRGRGGGRGRGGSTNRGGFNDFKGKKMTF